RNSKTAKDARYTCCIIVNNDKGPGTCNRRPTDATETVTRKRTPNWSRIVKSSGLGQKGACKWRAAACDGRTCSTREHCICIIPWCSLITLISNQQNSSTGRKDLGKYRPIASCDRCGRIYRRAIATKTATCASRWN